MIYRHNQQSAVKIFGYLLISLVNCMLGSVKSFWLGLVKLAPTRTQVK